MSTRGTSLLGGLALLLIARAQAAAQTPVFTLNSIGQPPSFGTDVDAVGDWDGDGIGDIAVGIPADILDGLPLGSVKVVSGHDGLLLAQVWGTVSKERFGALVAGAGDVDGDGAVDLAVGSVGIGPADPTRVKVFSGATDALLYTQPLPWLGLQDVTGAGDANADGYADVAEGGFDCTGTIGTSDNGDVKLLGGPSGALLHTWCGDGPGDHFGEDLAAAGDVNGDGYADLVVGAREADDYSPGATGYVRVLSGFDYATLYTVEGPPDEDNSGYAETLDAAGDVNGDGTPDIVVGARQEKVGGLFMGSATVYSGAGGAVLHHVLGTLANEQFGIIVAGPGDTDGDGLADFAVATGQLDLPGTPQPGYVVYSGADASELHDVPLDFIGLSGAGDLNADGTPDLLVVYSLPAPINVTISALSGAPVLFEDLGFALAGSQGTPHLEIEGVLHHGLPLTLTVTAAPALAPLFLVLGNAAAPVPFHGGVLVPVPAVIVTLGTDAAGALTLGTTSPALPSGTQVVVQGWLPDAPAPTHFAATNAVLGVAP
jgi:hypothetical protein